MILLLAEQLAGWNIEYVYGSAIFTFFVGVVMMIIALGMFSVKLRN